MTYYDHASALAHRLDPWDNRPTPHRNEPKIHADTRKARDTSLLVKTENWWAYLSANPLSERYLSGLWDRFLLRHSSTPNQQPQPLSQCECSTPMGEK